MLLPQTYVVTLIVMIFGMLCLGSWANTFKMGGRWRFELYYFDFALGALVAAMLLAFTVGSTGFDGFSFTDDLMQAGKRQWFYAFLAGMIFNLANMLLTAAISVAGMAVAFPIGIGSAVVVGSLLSLLLGHESSPMFLLAGCVAILFAIVADGIAYSSLGVLRHEALARAGKAKSTRRPSSLKAIVLALVSGLFMGSFAPLIQNSMEGDLALGPYSISALFAMGVFFSSIAFNIFFINLPVEGEPVEMRDFFRARPKKHLLGWSGGALWAAGSTAILVAASAPAHANLGQPLTYQLTQAFAVIATLWGLLAWKEFSGSDGKVRFLSMVMVVLYVAGLVLISLAQVYVRPA
ncbi:MAG: GRP family sugar transporter [Candidatus Sulfopaludibacter sp.]|nr:GRP family sugar transporter [Candidatus Sulfopaludibacter sp.]